MTQHRVKEGLELLKKNGSRMTPQRKAIMEYLANTKSHPTADQIFNSIKDQFPNLPHTTVYNNLKCLKKYGIINELTYGQSSSRYEWTTAFHYHVVCDSCGQLHDFHYPKLEEVEQYVEKKSRFNVTQHLFEIHGTCLDCKNENVSFKES
jgi:Fur family transcriptional regulator, peroxide stress response regulator